MLSPEARKKMLWGAGILGACFLVLQLAPPLAEYLGSPYALILKQLADASRIGLFGIILIVALLMRMGILPSAPKDPAIPKSQLSVGNGLTTLVIWIVVAVVLVFFFNLGESQKGQGGYLDDKTITLLVNYLPFVLMFAVWGFFLWRMQVKKKRDLDGGSNS